MFTCSVEKCENKAEQIFYR